MKKLKFSNGFNGRCSCLLLEGPSRRGTEVTLQGSQPRNKSGSIWYIRHNILFSSPAISPLWSSSFNSGEVAELGGRIKRWTDQDPKTCSFLSKKQIGEGGIPGSALEPKFAPTVLLRKNEAVGGKFPQGLCSSGVAHFVHSCYPDDLGRFFLQTPLGFESLIPYTI